MKTTTYNGQSVKNITDYGAGKMLMHLHCGADGNPAWAFEFTCKDIGILFFNDAIEMGMQDKVLAEFEGLASDFCKDVFECINAEMCSLTNLSLGDSTDFETCAKVAIETFFRYGKKSFLKRMVVALLKWCRKVV